MKLLAILFLLVFFCRCASAQSVLQVRDAASGQVLEGATIQCKGSEGVLVSDFIVIDGSEACIVRYAGYEPLALRPGFTRDTLVVYLHPSTRLLSAVTVQGYQEKTRLTDIAGGYGYLNTLELEAFQQASPVAAFNTIPGVRMEQRSPGSYRFNMRGSTLRSPFGVRNVKIYRDEIPFTEPTGSTPFNMLDIGSLSSAEIIRGPAGSVYGAGIGGVIMLQSSLPDESGTTISGDFTGGSYGLINTGISLANRSDNHSIELRGSLNKSNGYRDHSAMNRKNFSVAGLINLNKQNLIRYQLMFADLAYELPGGLTTEQRDEDPKMAREAAVEQNSRIDQDYLLSGLSYEYNGDSDQVMVSAFFSSSNKINPFITNYEFEDLSGAGARARYSKSLPWANGSWHLVAGGEWQWGNQSAENFGNDGGFPDTLRYEDSNDQFTGFEYAQLSYEKNGWNITGGASINHLNYHFDRVKDVALDSAYTLKRNFNIVISPRLAVVRNFGQWAVHGSYSLGFSPPTLDEIRTSDGGINEDLVAERGHNIEFGVRGDFVDNKLVADLNLFQLWQNNTIVSQVTEGGISTFQNSGSTSQRGIELLIGYSLIQRASGFLRSLYLETSLTLNHFRFTEYEKAVRGENVDYSGNKLTGAPGYMQSTSLNLTFGKEWNAEIRHMYVNQIPLNDANTVFSNSYNLLQARIGWEKPVSGTSSLRLFAGVDNLLNEQYSLGNDLNAFGSRYFNPSAEINMYAGVRFSFYCN